MTPFAEIITNCTMRISIITVCRANNRTLIPEMTENQIALSYSNKH